jgi:alanine-alpha-ketoisovalerate/valine-pyruvate aminotransferase
MLGFLDCELLFGNKFIDCVSLSSDGVVIVKHNEAIGNDPVIQGL